MLSSGGLGHGTSFCGAGSDSSSCGVNSFFKIISCNSERKLCWLVLADGVEATKICFLGGFHLFIFVLQRLLVIVLWKLRRHNIPKTSRSICGFILNDFATPF